MCFLLSWSAQSLQRSSQTTAPVPVFQDLENVRRHSIAVKKSRGIARKKTTP
jgi:hypothetical protein